MLRSEFVDARIGELPTLELVAGRVRDLGVRGALWMFVTLPRGVGVLTSPGNGMHR